MTEEEKHVKFISNEGKKICSRFDANNRQCFDCIDIGTWEFRKCFKGIK